MKRPWPWLVVLLLCGAVNAEEPITPGSVPTFRMQEIDTKLEVGYAVLVEDVNGDGKPDLVVVDTTRVVWYENPTWKKRVILEGGTRRDNVCISAADIDGDGKVDFAVGADWKPFNTRSGGTLQWLKRGATLDEPWSMYPIGEEPTVHRIRFLDLYGEGRPRLVVVPLMGRNSTRENNWMDGSPVRVLAFRIPKDPIRDRWIPEVIHENLHVVHNFCAFPPGDRKGVDILAASYEGVTLLSPGKTGAPWMGHRLGEGNQEKPRENRGASEIKQGNLGSTGRFIATIEPWHGHQVVVYTPPKAKNSSPLWTRNVVDAELKWGHAVGTADLDGDGKEELIIGVRDDLGMKPTQRRGVRIYQAQDTSGTKWRRHDLDAGGVAVEDLVAADLNGDGRIDLVAVGRQTRNVRIYWNEKKP